MWFDFFLNSYILDLVDWGKDQKYSSFRNCGNHMKYKIIPFKNDSFRKLKEAKKLLKGFWWTTAHEDKEPNVYPIALAKKRFFENSRIRRVIK